MIRKKLINGRMMVCPRCKQPHDVLQYIRLETIEEFELETVPVYKCPSCKWLFAPAGEATHEVYERYHRDLQEILKTLKAKEVVEA